MRRQSKECKAENTKLRKQSEGCKAADAKSRIQLLQDLEGHLLWYIHGIRLEDHRINKEIQNLAGVNAVGILMRT